jgi:hypothetical protein
VGDKLVVDQIQKLVPLLLDSISIVNDTMFHKPVPELAIAPCLEDSGLRAQIVVTNETTSQQSVSNNTGIGILTRPT